MKTEKHILSVFLPTWSIDLIYRRMRLAQQGAQATPLNETLLLVSKHAGKQIVCRRSEKAKQAGVWLGMGLSNARAAVPGAQVYPFDPIYEENALHKLSEWAYAFSPLVTPDKRPQEKGPVSDPRYSGLALDASGSKRLFGGYPNFLIRLSKELALLGFHSRLAIAPSYGAAWALARYGQKRCSLTTEEALRGALAPLPVTALRLGKKIEHALSELNITRIEHLFTLPRKTLLCRFGPELGERLDQAFGAIDEPIEPAAISPHLRVEKIFDGVVTQFDALVFSVCELLKELLDTLDAQQKKVSVLVLEVKTAGRPARSDTFPLSAPSRNKKHLWALLQKKLDQLNMGFGVESIALSAPQQEAVIPVKTSYLEALSEGDATKEHLGELVDIMHNALGSESVLQVETTASHLPEKAFRYRSVKKGALARRQLEMPALVKADRPSVLFPRPQPVHAMAALPDSPPSWIKWHGQTFKLEDGVGPERIAPEWWQRKEQERFGAPVESCTRDYFKVLLPSGTWVWIFREIETSNWFVHGVWA